MIADELASRILQTFGLLPTTDQRMAVNIFCRFMTSRNERQLMILRGSAGTGKTSLAAAMVKTLAKLGQKVILMAPTGRAAKVFSLTADMPAMTIHRKIYRQKTFVGEDTSFSLGNNMHHDTVFVVDEASMIANSGMSEQALFATGRLLDDIVKYVFSGRNCRLMLIGDKAQLPPIGEDESPALSSAFMEGYALEVCECDLDMVVRQAEDSGILYNATMIRRMITRDEVTMMPKIKFSEFADIVKINGDELIESLASSYSEVGIDETMVVTRSNKRANIYNSGIRNMVLGYEEQMVAGDMLMVVRNNYYWTDEKNDKGFTFIANGDRAKVRRIRNIRELYNFRFADATLQFPDYDDVEIEATVMLDSLMSEAPSITREQSMALFNAVNEDYMDITKKSERMKKVREDKHYNALQIKYAYAVTCHKAQGGQWAHVYVDQGYITKEMINADFMHWLYTAFTRTADKLFLVNWKDI
ncbi:MAG: AAA family ATPase [Prevotella sp.]|nr:AAA family ATPase [Paraprevotella sp.]MDD7691890.1 AAA family ATPase [Prevotella sp.]